MNEENEIPEFDEFGESQSGNIPKKEGDEQEQEFLSRLKRLSEEAEANAEGRQANFDFSEDEIQDEPFKPEFAGDLQNPTESYDLFYAIRRLLMQCLPKGIENQEFRQIIYDEKNLFLRQGVERPQDGSKVGADSRQSRLSFLREAFTKTQDWAKRGGAPYDIFIEYYDLNKKMRYR